jgi:hypothetical protein
MLAGSLGSQLVEFVGGGGPAGAADMSGPA